MIGKLIGERKSKPVRRAVRPDQIHPGEFWLLARIFSKSGRDKIGTGCHQPVAVAFVKPFWLHSWSGI